MHKMQTILKTACGNIKKSAFSTFRSMSWNQLQKFTERITQVFAQNTRIWKLTYKVIYVKFAHFFPPFAYSVQLYFKL